MGRKKYRDPFSFDALFGNVNPKGVQDVFLDAFDFDVIGSMKEDIDRLANALVFKNPHPFGAELLGARETPRKTMFYDKPHHPSIAKIVTFVSVEDAKRAVKKLLRMFRRATRKKKLIILKAVQLASNRARAGAKNPKFSASTRRKWLKIAEIYERASEIMEREYKK